MSTHFDQLKDLITRLPKTQCLKTVPINQATLGAQYRDFNLFLNIRFAEATTRAMLDFNGRFAADVGFITRTLISIRSSLMTSRSRQELNTFVCY